MSGARARTAHKEISAVLLASVAQQVAVGGNNHGSHVRRLCYELLSCPSLVRERWPIIRADTDSVIHLNRVRTYSIGIVYPEHGTALFYRRQLLSNLCP